MNKKIIFLAFVLFLLLFSCTSEMRGNLEGVWIYEISGVRYELLTLNKDKTYIWEKYEVGDTTDFLLDRAEGTYEADSYKSQSLVYPVLYFDKQVGESSEKLPLQYYVSPNGNSLILKGEKTTLFIRVRSLTEEEN